MEHFAFEGGVKRETVNGDKKRKKEEEKEVRILFRKQILIIHFIWHIFVRHSPLFRPYYGRLSYNTHFLNFGNNY